MMCPVQQDTALILEIWSSYVVAVVVDVHELISPLADLYRVCCGAC